MPHSLSAEEVSRLRLRAQQLVPGSGTASDVAAVVRQIVGIQAQDARAAALSIRARGPGLTADDVDRALGKTRSVVRTWLMRGTIHLAAAEDLGWLLALLGPRFNTTSRRRREALGLDDDTAVRSARTLENVLRDEGPLTRAEIRALPALDRVPLDGQAAPHLIRYAALDGRICYGPTRNGAPTYAALDGWIDRPPAPDEADALTTLTRRYLRACGPAGPRDLAAWSGLTLTQARAGFAQIGDDLAEIAVGNDSMWMLAGASRSPDTAPSAPVARLLPKYDTLLLGYRSRDWILPEAHAARIHPGGGLLRRSVLVDGRIVGTWEMEQQSDDTLRVVVEPFETLPPPAREALAAEAEDVARFLGRWGMLEIAG